MKIKMTNETKTGIMVVVCVAVLLVLIVKVGNFGFFQKGYVLKSHFQFASGIKKHAPVQLSGVGVGEVQDIQVVYGNDTLVELTFWIQEGVKIQLDSQAYITTLGLMGEKYIEIKAGSHQAGFAQDGDLIGAESPIRLEDLMKTGTEIATDIGEMAENISTLTQNLDETVNGNKSKINRIFDNLEESSGNFREFSQDIKYHPWKVLAKRKEKTKAEMESMRDPRFLKREQDADIIPYDPASQKTAKKGNAFIKPLSERNQRSAF